MLRTLGSTASAPGISPHRHGLAVLLDILEECDGALQLPAVDGLGSLAGVLVGNAQVGAAGAGALRGLDVGGGVADLQCNDLVSAYRTMPGDRGCRNDRCGSRR